MTLAKAVSSTSDFVINPYNLTSLYARPAIGDVPHIPGVAPFMWSFLTSQIAIAPVTYGDELVQSRFFYHYDPTASTVINRMAELAAGTIRNRKNNCSEEEFNYFNSIIKKVQPLVNTCALEYLIAGMAIPD